MATLNRNIQTNAGTKLWTTTLSGENKIIYVKAELYAKKVNNLTDEQLAGLTSVDTPLLKCNLAVTDMSDQNIRLSAEFTNDTLQHDIAFNSIGWFASTVVDQAQGKEPILFAISEIDTESNLIAPTENSSTSFFLAQLVMGVSNTNNVQLIAGTTGYVKFPDLEQRILQLANQGLIDLGNRLSQDSSVLDLHNTSLHYVPAGTVKGLPVTEDKDNLGGFLISMGNGATTQDGVQIYFEPFTHKTFISYFLKKNNEWSQWIEVGSQSYTKEEINKILDDYAKKEELKEKADVNSVYTKDKIDSEFDKITNGMVTSVDDIKPEKGNVSLEGKYATSKNVSDATNNLLDFITKLKAFKDKTTAIYDNELVNLDLAKNKQVGIIKFTNCNLSVNSFNSNIKLNTTNDFIQIEHDKNAQIGTNNYSGWVINIPVDDAENHVYQYVIANNIDTSDNTRLFYRYVPINASQNDKNDYSLSELTKDPVNTAKTAFNASRLSSIKMEKFYDYSGFDEQTRNTIENDTIDLDAMTLAHDIGIRRFSNCTLKTKASIAPYNEDSDNINKELITNGKYLSGWVVILPTNKDDQYHLSVAGSPLQVLVCYDRTIFMTSTLANRGLEVYYRFIDTNNPTNPNNNFVKFQTTNYAFKGEVSKGNLDFNKMFFNTIGETTFSDAINNGNKKPSELGMPAIYDLALSSIGAVASPTKYSISKIPFSYRVLTQQNFNDVDKTINFYQEIKSFGFIFCRSGSWSQYITIFEAGDYPWQLKEIYNPITELFNGQSKNSNSNAEVCALILPDNTSLDFVGLTTYSDYKFNESATKFFPQGTYYLSSKFNYQSSPANYPGYLMAFNVGNLRLQFISYLVNGSTINYIRSGGPNAIGTWKMI